MTRVAVTGIGAVSPLGLDAPTTWSAALAGQSGIDWISVNYDTRRCAAHPDRRAEGEEIYDPQKVASARGCRGSSSRNVLLRALGGKGGARRLGHSRTFDRLRGSRSSSARRSAGSSRSAGAGGDPAASSGPRPGGSELPTARMSSSTQRPVRSRSRSGSRRRTCADRLRLPDGLLLRSARETRA